MKRDEAQVEPPICNLEPHAFEAATNPVVVHLRNYLPGDSRKSVQTSLERLARIASGGQIAARDFPWHRLRFEHVTAIRERLEVGYEPATRNHSLSVLREILRTCWKLDLITAQTRDRLTFVRSFRESGRLRGRALPGDEIKKLFAAVGKAAATGNHGAIRDAAILGVLFGVGLRRREAIRLDLADYDPVEGALLVHGKGGRARIGYLQAGGREALDAWIRVREKQPGPLFGSVNKAGKVTLRQISPRAVYEICQVWAKRAAIPAFSPHDLRRSCITSLLDAGIDLSTVRSMAGHALVATTTKYDFRGERAKKAASEQLPFPDLSGQR